jgi:hypothetical protein
MRVFAVASRHCCDHLKKDRRVVPGLRFRATVHVEHRPRELHFQISHFVAPQVSLLSREQPTA